MANCRTDASPAARGGRIPTIAIDRQPDQQPERWDNHVLLYESVFEPLSVAFARQATALLGLKPGARVLDVGAGAGGAALALAESGAAVTAIDASPGMVERIRVRAGPAVEAHVMDGMRLGFPDAAFDAALSVFGVILFPEAEKGLSEMRRVVRPGGLVAVVTWTEPHRYELAANLQAAIVATVPNLPAPATLPAQLRFANPEAFRSLFATAGFVRVEIRTTEARLPAESARWLADRLAFAPGMEAWLSGLGERRASVLDALVERLEHVHGTGAISLGAVAAIGIGQVG